MSRTAWSLILRSSPRHVPDRHYQLQDIPPTLTGKKMRVPVRRLLPGAPVEKVAQPDTMANPESIGFLVALAREFADKTTDVRPTA